jgi:hypothetical protein
VRAPLRELTVAESSPLVRKRQSCLREATVVERWARQLVQDELGRVVELHDDGSRPSMYDLRVGPIESPEVAIECTGALDPIRVETWNVGPARGSWSLPLAGDWIVSVRRGARINILRQRLGSVLSRCEELGVLTSLHVDWALKRANPDLFLEFATLGIDWAGCYRYPGTGRVSFAMEGIGGWVDSEGVALPGWIAEFLNAPERQDVLHKLVVSGARERHVFIVVDFGGATFSVESYLAGPLEVLPAESPILPAPVTGVWLTSTSSDRGVRWSGGTWKHFAAVWKGRGNEAGPTE